MDRCLPRARRARARLLKGVVDLARAIGLAAWEQLSEEERRTRTVAWEKRYWEEFSKRGVERVVVVAPPGEG